MLKDPKPAIAVDVTWPDGLVSTATPKEKAPAKDAQPPAPPAPKAAPAGAPAAGGGS